MLAGALGWYRTQWSDIASRKVSWKWTRDRESINKHLARFLLMGFYTGTRPGAIMDCQWIANVQGGWVDVDRGVFHRKADSAAVSNKRQPPARLGQRILMHLRRWKRMDEATRDRLAKELGIPVTSHMHVVAWRGGGVKDVGNAFAKALQLAGLPANYTPHIVRHTRATWLMQARVDLWEAAGSLGMSVETLQKVYGHHHPDFQRKAAEV
jgi:integrase